MQKKKGRLSRICICRQETTIEIPNEYLVKTKLEWEKIFLGGYISDHPIGELESESLRINSWRQIMIAGLLIAIGR